MSKASSGADIMRGSNSVGSAVPWMYRSMVKTVSAGYLCVFQGGLLRLLWTYPACLIPMVLAIAASMMTFPTITSIDILFMGVTGAKATFEFGSAHHIAQLGEPACRFAGTVALLYFLFFCVVIRSWSSGIPSWESRCLLARWYVVRVRRYRACQEFRILLTQARRPKLLRNGHHRSQPARSLQRRIYP